CPGSIVGQGAAQINNGAVSAVVTAFAGPSSPTPTIYLHSFIGNALPIVLTGSLNTSANTLTVGIPLTPGQVITEFDTTINKVKTGGKNYYIMARCSKKKKYVNSETTTYTNGQTTSATSTQKCKQKASKK